MIDNSIFGNRTALFHTFGCKLNFAETSTIARMLAERGIRRATPSETPDFIVINTCSVTELADKKCRQTIRSFHKRYPDAAIVVTGCYAQLKSDEVASLPGVMIVGGIDEKLALADFIDRWCADHEPQTVVTAAKDIRRFLPSCSSDDRTRHFLKVQDGCDYWCSYCTIPRARGRSRSGTIDQLVAMARDVAAQGGKEIVITGVNIGETFHDLVRALDRVDGIERYRISSIEPNLLTDEIIDFVASSRSFMPHFHIPLQSGDDDVLRLMRRHYDTALFASKIERIRRVMPDAFIGVDLIVGARGETPERFARSKTFVESIDISRLHVFTYSERPGTRALEIEHVVTQEEKHRRTREMLAVSTAKLDAFSRRFVGTVRPALIERPKDSHNVGGFTDNYLRIVADVAPDTDIAALDNRIVSVEITDVVTDDETVKARLIL